MKKSSKRGFTLIELLVVIAIIGILSGIILVALSGSRAKARDAERVSDLNQIQLALALFFDRCGQYPQVTALSASSACPTNSSITFGTYLAQVPVPPAGASQAAYDYDYYKTSGNVAVNYILHAKLEGNNAAVAKGLDASAIYDAAGSNWFKHANASPYSFCSSGSTSVDYCIGPN